MASALVVAEKRVAPKLATWLAIFYLKGVYSDEVKLTDIYKGAFPFIILQLIT